MESFPNMGSSEYIITGETSDKFINRQYTLDLTSAE